MPRSPRATPFFAADVPRSLIGGLIAAALTIAISFLFAEQPEDGLLRLSLYLSWCSLVVVLTGLIFLVYTRASEPELRAWLLDTRAPRNPVLRVLWSTGGGGAIWWAISGAVITMYTLVDLALQPTEPTPTLIGVGIAVVVASFTMIIVSYALHYARINAEADGFEFPGGGEVRFIDYLYLAAQVSTTFASSDVQLTTSRARRAVTFQSIVSMAFNTVLVSLFVSVLLRAAQPAS